MAERTPSEVVEDFTLALGSRDAGAATALFSRKGCVVTPDSTVIQGRDRIGGFLQQLVDLAGELTIDQRAMLTAGDVAVSTGSWNMRTGSVWRRSRSTIVLGRIEGHWRIAVADPWHA